MGNGTLREKPYEFVPWIRTCERKESSSHASAEAGTYSGKLLLKLTVESPLHIGSGQQEVDDYGNIIKLQTRRNGIPVIPGSSLKGAVRSVAEAVSHSCAVKPPDKMLKKCLPPENREPCTNIEDGLCITCSMFGTQGYRGKIDFGEFLQEQRRTKKERLPQLESPFQDTSEFGGNERLYYCKACGNDCQDGWQDECQDCTSGDAAVRIRSAGDGRNIEFRGRKFYSTDRENAENEGNRKEITYEMLNVGNVLSGEILFQNLREEEGRLLAYALNLAGSFTMKLGYGKPLGYGKVRMELTGVEDFGDRYSSCGTGSEDGDASCEKECGQGGSVCKRLNKETVVRWGKEYKENCGSEDIKNAVEEFERIMKRPADESERTMKKPADGSERTMKKPTSDILRSSSVSAPEEPDLKDIPRKEKIVPAAIRKVEDKKNKEELAAIPPSAREAVGNCFRSIQRMNLTEEEKKEKLLHVLHSFWRGSGKPVGGCKREDVQHIARVVFGIYNVKGSYLDREISSYTFQELYLYYCCVDRAVESKWSFLANGKRTI